MFAATPVASADDPITFEKDIHPLVQTYCFGCHNPDKFAGELNLMRFETTDSVVDALAIWRRMGKRLEDKEMPPRNARKPTDEERSRIVKWIGSLKNPKDDCNKIATEENVSSFRGYVMSRRLNRAEYENTIRDLFGVEIDVAKLFPADGAGGEGFDNNGEALFLSAIQIEKYLDAADLAVDTIFPEKRSGFISRIAEITGRALHLAPLKPTSEKQLEAARRRIITARPGLFANTRTAARKVIADFAARAWRRPVMADEVAELLTMFDRGYKRGDGYDASLKLAIKTALVSPHFLFLAEPEPPKPGVYELGDTPLASRLSYFLWSSMPDAELFSLARSGELHTTETLQLQVRRMLRDPKAKALGENFATQWLGIAQLGGATRPDPNRYPEFSDELADSMRREPIYFFNRIVQENRSLLDLIDSKYTYADARLVKLYDLPAVHGDGMQLVQLADANRGGVLGMAGILTATSQPLRTSPVLRGKWVLEQVLGDRIPPPPANVTQLPADDVQPDGITLRARLEAHRKQPECASCHQKMDPIGFGLENFDPIGRWRKEAAGKPIDPAGVLPSGERFDGPRELKEIVLKRKDDFARNVSRKMLGYALGRPLTDYDNCVVDAAVKAMQADDYRPSHLFEEIALSYPFRHRYSRK